MSEVVELRQYTLHPGARETLVELFERELVAPQEACGMRILGRFRDLADPDRFVWFRSFPDMARRKEALTCFYGGAVWKRHRDAANATMIDSDDVLLLRFIREGVLQPPPAETPFIVTTYSFRRPVDEVMIDLLARALPAAALLRTEDAVNDFPALPVRGGEHVVVAAGGQTERDDTPAALLPELAGPPVRLILEPVMQTRPR